MRSPLGALRDLRAEFTRVMAEHEEFLRAQFVPDPDRLARARELRTSHPHRHTPGETPAEGARHANE